MAGLRQCHTPAPHRASGSNRALRQDRKYSKPLSSFPASRQLKPIIRLCERLALWAAKSWPYGEPMKRFEDEFPTEWALSPGDSQRDLEQPTTDNDQELKKVEPPV